ncbi:MAG: hypothetical protein JO161_04750 [Planctomycetaceae bacterium]|nr:hypothetical protein [Planctomycetaceae bacterium]
MARMTDHRFPMRGALTDPRQVHSLKPALDDTTDLEEFPLLLQPSEVHELIEAARQEGLSAASLARWLIRDYLLWVRSDLGKAPSPKLRLRVPGEER